MRKDVKVGLASGGVLLAVVIVYANSLNQPAAPARSPLTSKATDGASQPKPVGTVQIASDTEPNRDFSPAATGNAVAVAPSEPDWSKLLETGAPPALMTHTPVPGPKTDEPAAAPVDVFTDTAPPTDQTTATPETAIESIAPAPLAATTFNPPARAVVQMPAAPSMRTHVVKSGESFYTIAREIYGNSHYYPHILRANPGVDANKIRPGMTINIPDPSVVKPTASPVVHPTRSTTATPASAGEYRVANNDNLYRISVKLYGSPAKMDEIYQLNKATIGDDPARLKVGTVLKLPAPPRQPE